MFFETRKLMESSNIGYMHDLPAKFQDYLKNSRHTPIILVNNFANHYRANTICNYKTKYHLKTCIYHKVNEHPNTMKQCNYCSIFIKSFKHKMQ